MTKNNHTTCFKNMICISVGLLIIFTTSIFVAKDFYGLKIKELIDEATLLKDYHFSYWGQFPGNIDAEYNHRVTLFNYSNTQMHTQTDPTPTPTLTLEHSFEYKNVSFGQGNQGFIKYLHNWDLTSINSLPQTPVATLSPAAEKVYNYERLATAPRRFATMYNVLWETLEQMLTKIYAFQMHEFYIKNQKIVYDSIFNEIGLTQEVKDTVYNDDVFGWKSVETFEVWVKLCNQKDRKNLREYEMIQEELGLSSEVLDRLVGEHSMLSTLSTALNGTIKLIVENPKTIFYKDCVPFCTNDQLVAFQILTGGLTSASLFIDINMQQSLKDLNATLLDDVEFNQFCPECMPDAIYLDFFSKRHLGNFTIITKVFENLTDTDNIQDLFELPDETYVSHVVDYMQYLHDSIFNAVNPTTQEVDSSGYNFMLNNHLYVNSAVNNLKDVIFIGLHANGLEQMIKNAGIKCQDFFTGDYKSFAKLCEKDEFNLNQPLGVRNYVKAYFFQGREQFAAKTTMTTTQLTQFLKLDPQSLFAIKMKELKTAIKDNYGCEKVYCTPEELLWREWSGEQDVLSHLPADLFPNPPKSILEWDAENKLNGVQLQYHKLMNEKLSYEQGQLLLGSGVESLLVLSNLLTLKVQTDCNDSQAKKLINYVQRVAIDVFFGGPTTTRPISDFVLGYQSVGIVQKQNQNILLGGAPWIDEKVALFQTKHRPTVFNKVNTGIYDKTSLRRMLEYNHYKTLGSELTVFQSEYEQIKEYLPSGRSVFGTNLLGFHSQISSSESLTAFLDFAYQGVVLIPQDISYNFNGVDCIKYSIKQSSVQTFIGFDQQNERSIIIQPESYFIVDPITGNTLQFLVKYSVITQASFLKYYYLDTPSTFKLYTNQVYYSRRDVSSITEIAQSQQSLKTLYIVTIVLASLSMISVVVFAVIYRLKSKRKNNEFNDTLITSQTGSLTI